MDYINRTLLSKKDFESINGDYYKKFTSYEIDLIKERDALLSYLSATLTALNFMEKSFGKVNDKVIEFRKYYNQVNSNYNDINEVLANNKELSDKIDSAFLEINIKNNTRTMDSIEQDKCDFCKEIRQVNRTYLKPSRYVKSTNLTVNNHLYNQGDYFIIVKTCEDCGKPKNTSNE